jgi:hypothetical protein
MLQSLLEERFKVRVHRERQDRPIYKLVIARGDRLSLGLKRAPLACGARADTRPAGTPGLAYCGIDQAPGRSTGRSMPLRLLADTLSARVGRKVIDETPLQASGIGTWSGVLRRMSLSALATSPRGRRPRTDHHFSRPCRSSWGCGWSPAVRCLTCLLSTQSSGRLPTKRLIPGHDWTTNEKRRTGSRFDATRSNTLGD